MYDKAGCRPHTRPAYFLGIGQYLLCRQYILGIAEVPIWTLVEHQIIHGKPKNIHHLEQLFGTFQQGNCVSM